MMRPPEIPEFNPWKIMFWVLCFAMLFAWLGWVFIETLINVLNINL